MTRQEQEDRNAPQRSADSAETPNANMESKPALSVPAPSSSRGPRQTQDIPVVLQNSILETSKGASQAYFVYMSFLAYCTLTILTTSDDRLILHKITVLPLVSLPMPSNQFLVVAPLIAIGLFVYFEFYHCRLTGLLRDAASFGPIDKTQLYPWLITFGEQPDEGFVGSLQRLVVQFSLWCTLPGVLLLCTVLSLKSDDLRSTVLIGAISIVGVCIVALFWRRYSRVPVIARWAFLAILIGVEIGLVSASVLVVTTGYYGNRIPGKVRPWWDDLATPYLTVDLREVDLSSRRDWQSTDLAGARLEEAKFNNVHLNNAVLAGAELERSGFDGADLSNANMQGADLSFASFKKALLAGAQLDRARLFQSDLSDSNLSAATLRRAFLRNADLTDALAVAADFRDSNLDAVQFKGTNLVMADLEGASLLGAQNLTVDQLQTACTLFSSTLDQSVRDKLRAKNAKLLEKPQRDEQGNCTKAAN